MSSDWGAGGLDGGGRTVSVTDLPMAPTSLRMDAVTRDSVTLRWDAPPDTGGVPLSGYIVEQQDGGKTAPGSAARWKVAAYVDPTRTSWTVGGLIQGYEYWFRVRAENPDGAGSACTLSSAVIPKPVVRKLLTQTPYKCFSLLTISVVKIEQSIGCVFVSVCVDGNVLNWTTLT